MAYKNIKILAIVPARGGSKGIIGKNLRKIGDKSLIALTADIAQKTPYIDRVVLSTDNQEIFNEGEKCGLEIPFMRPSELAGDSALSVDVWRHAWVESEKTFKESYQVSLLLEPTSPFRKVADLEAVVDLLINNSNEIVVTVSKTPPDYSPEKALTIGQDGNLNTYLVGGERYTIRQELPNYYYRNGVCYGITKNRLFEEGITFGRGCAAVVIDRPVVNIDTHDDLDNARRLFREGI